MQVFDPKKLEEDVRAAIENRSAVPKPKMDFESPEMQAALSYALAKQKEKEKNSAGN